MTDEELLRSFESGDEPQGGFHHEQHVRVAWMYLQRLPLAEALGRFTSALKHFAEKQGATGLYHETITVAFVLLINERLSDSHDLRWPEFAARHQDLLAWKPSILDRFYRAETLSSPRARLGFVMPDRLAP